MWFSGTSVWTSDFIIFLLKILVIAVKNKKMCYDNSSNDWLNDWSTVLSTYQLIDQLTYWPTDWLIDQLTDWPTDKLTDRLIDWLTDVNFSEWECFMWYTLIFFLFLPKGVWSFMRGFSRGLDYVQSFGYIFTFHWRWPAQGPLMYVCHSVCVCVFHISNTRWIQLNL